MKRSKRYLALKQKIDKTKKYLLDEAISVLKEMTNAKFDQTVELSVKLGVDPRHADHMVRGALVLPNGTGKSVKVLVFAKGDKEKEAVEAGADYVGAEDLVEKINNGWFDFDIAISTPDMMALVGKLGKVLGPKGLMPNPKSGTVTFDVANVIKEAKLGRVEYRVDKTGVVNVPVGKASFENNKLKENIIAVLDSIIRAKPASLKGTYIKNISLALTMSPGIKLDSLAIVQEIVSSK